MNPFIANAEIWDPSQTEFDFILRGSAGIAVACALVGLIVFLARHWEHRHTAQLTLAALFWGLIAVATILYAIVTQLALSKENYLEMMSGYGDGRPPETAVPWFIWISLGAAYLVLLNWTVLER